MSLPYTQSNWQLTDLYPALGSPELEAALEEIEAKTTGFEKYRTHLAADLPAETFLDILRSLEAINWLSSRLYSFAGLGLAADTQSQEIQTLAARLDQCLADVQNRVLFFSLWWKGIDQQAAQRLLAASGKYHYFLDKMHTYKPHTLSEPEEKIINIKDVTGSKAIKTLYDVLTNRYVFKLDVGGEKKELTRGELMAYVRGGDADLRARAYQELYRVFGEDGSILGQMYQNLVRDWRNEQVDLRHFNSPISAANLAYDIPDEVAHTLLEVCRRNAPLFQRYFRLKARLLGMDRLRRCDIFAPVAKSDKRYAFESAAGMVLDSFESFDPEIAALARRVLEQGHLDSEVRKGKRGGAFSWSVNPEVTPWVLLNYQGRSEDVVTMAHELGHAVHSMLASGHTQFDFISTFPLAETASTFGEMMLVDRRLAEEDDEEVRRDLLFRQLDAAYSTIMRQAFFALFERTAHEMVQQGASVDDLANAYIENLRAQFGDAVEVSAEFRWEWVSIPHFYDIPFNVYGYAFGQLLVFSLYKQYQAEGESFKPRYLKILAAGGSDSPERILSAAGIDIRSADFWQSGFDVIKDMLDRLAAEDEQKPI